jgi:hypothetical protein
MAELHERLKPRPAGHRDCSRVGDLWRDLIHAFQQTSRTDNTGHQSDLGCTMGIGRLARKFGQALSPVRISVSDVEASVKESERSTSVGTHPGPTRRNFPPLALCLI